MQHFSIDWRQARIFTSDFSNGWYFRLLSTFVVPLAQKYPETQFWFTRYAIPKGAGDDGDTNIDDLPANFLQLPGNVHVSIRLRFCPVSDEEAYLKSLFTPQYWVSDFRSYNVLGEFGGARFCSANDIADRMRRTELLARLLHTNSLYVLDNLAGANSYEENLDGQNAFNKSPFLSTLHLFNNIYGTANGDGFLLYAVNNPIGAPGGFAYCKL